MLQGSTSAALFLPRIGPGISPGQLLDIKASRGNISSRGMMSLPDNVLVHSYAASSRSAPAALL